MSYCYYGLIKGNKLTNWLGYKILDIV